MNQRSAPAFLSRTAIYLGFAATGVSMALPGAVLPTLLVQWSLADRQAGLFFFLGWIGTSVGALQVGASRARSLALGSALSALGSVALAFGAHWSCFVSMAVFGVGLGMTMTSISLLQAGRHAGHRAAELNRLNLVWALGACLCPTLAEHSLRIANTRVIFAAVGLFFAALSVWAVLFERDPAASGAVLPGPAPGSRILGLRVPGLRNLALWPIAIVVVMGLPTGIESSMGGWIAAYVQRTQGAIATTVTAGTCFWLGLLLSRLLSSTILTWWRSERAVLVQSLATVVLGMVLLIASRGSLGILPGVFLVGFGLGPVYPLLLAIALQYSENTMIFFVAGVGSACLPWLTGIVSSASASLRIGLLVPMAASALMLALGGYAAALKGGAIQRGVESV